MNSSTTNELEAALQLLKKIKMEEAEQNFLRLDKPYRDRFMDLGFSLAGIVREMKSIIEAAVETPKTTHGDGLTELETVENLIGYTDGALPQDIYETIHRDLTALDKEYTPQGVNRPSIYLFGDRQYIYNGASRSVHPTPIQSSPMMTELVAEVSRQVKCEFNSVLVNHYGTLKTELPYHKDDEAVLDPTAPVATLSFGAQRRFQISAAVDKNRTIHHVDLLPNSLCVMPPGFQDHYYHRLAAGRKSMPQERGNRYSLTFRKIRLDTPPQVNTLPIDYEPKPPVNSPPIVEPRPELPAHSDGDLKPPPKDKFDAVVLGSSLVKGLDTALLSKHGKNFKVIPHRGAHIKDVTRDITNIGVTNVSCKDVQTIFLVCGGNDIQNLPPDKPLDQLYKDYINLFKSAEETFPNAKIHAVSVIPRRLKEGIPHADRMWDVNEWLESHCKNNNMRFVNIFSFFLTKYVKGNDRYQQVKLFNNDQIHFNKIGNSVLAKVLIAVTHRPFNA